MFCAASFAVFAEAPFSFESTPGQLPKSVVPRHYAIKIKPDMEHFTTQGSATVDIEVLKPVKEIVLNALDLKITKAVLSAASEIILKTKLDKEKGTLTLKLPTQVAPGIYRLALEFTGKIVEQAQGLFYA